jgi:hypothetical protein
VPMVTLRSSPWSPRTEGEYITFGATKFGPSEATPASGGQGSVLLERVAKRKRKDGMTWQA